MRRKDSCCGNGENFAYNASMEEDTLAGEPTSLPASSVSTDGIAVCLNRSGTAELGPNAGKYELLQSDGLDRECDPKSELSI